MGKTCILFQKVTGKTCSSFQKKYKITNYLSRDCLRNVQCRLQTSNVTATRAFQHNNNQYQVLPAMIVNGPTMEQKVLTLDFMKELRDTITDVAREII